MFSISTPFKTYLQFSLLVVLLFTACNFISARQYGPYLYGFLNSGFVINSSSSSMGFTAPVRTPIGDTGSNEHALIEDISSIGIFQFLASKLLGWIQTYSTSFFGRTTIIFYSYVFRLMSVSALVPLVVSELVLLKPTFRFGSLYSLSAKEYKKKREKRRAVIEEEKVVTVTSSFKDWSAYLLVGVGLAIGSTIVYVGGSFKGSWTNDKKTFELVTRGGIRESTEANSVKSADYMRLKLIEEAVKSGMLKTGEDILRLIDALNKGK